MKRRLDMDKIAKGLGANRQGKVTATAGYFGAMQLVAEVEARSIEPMQLTDVLLEKSTEQVSDEEATQLLRPATSP